MSTTPHRSCKSKVGGGGDQVALELHRRGYRLGRGIGEGSYCKVKVAVAKGKKVACKIIDKKKASPDFVNKFLPRELSIARSLSHPHIVNVLDVVDIGSNVLIFMDYCEKGDLLEHIRANGALTEAKSKMLFRQILSAVSYLHSLDISHRDLKCENILLHTPDYVKITDFGFARRVRNQEGARILSDTFCGSAAYAAPEILQGISYNPSMYDSWSMGCVLFIMLTGTMPFDDSNVAQMLRAQAERAIAFPPEMVVSNVATKLIMHLLEPDVTRRSTITQAQNSNWLRVNYEHPQSAKP